MPGTVESGRYGLFFGQTDKDTGGLYQYTAHFYGPGVSKQMSGGKRFKTLYLHIGLGKTGTTSVQQQFLDNADLLESRYDIHFPRNFSQLHPFRGNHSIPVRAMFSENPAVRKRLAARGLETTESIEKYNKTTVADLERGFKSSSATRLLLSAEGVGHFRKDDMLGLAGWLHELADEVKVIACVRHPLHALSSEIQQRLTIGEVLEDLYKTPPFYRFRLLFENVERAFGQENVIAYDFAGAVSSEAGLAATFFENIGIKVGAEFKNTPTANVSISHEAALLISSLNRQRPVLVDGVRNPLRKVNDVQQIMKIPGRKYLAPPEVYEEVLSKIQPDIDWIKIQYQVDLGGSDFKVNRDYYSFSAETIDELALTLADYARQKYIFLSPLRFVYVHLRQLLNKLF